VSALNKSERAIAKQVAAWKRAKTSAKAAYDRADRILLQISERIECGLEVRISESGKCVVLLDNYAGKHIVWAHGAVRRWDLEIVDRP
jgi:hypothetical protein